MKDRGTTTKSPWESGRETRWAVRRSAGHSEAEWLKSAETTQRQGSFHMRTRMRLQRGNRRSRH